MLSNDHGYVNMCIDFCYITVLTKVKVKDKVSFKVTWAAKVKVTKGQRSRSQAKWTRICHVLDLWNTTPVKVKVKVICKVICMKNLPHIFSSYHCVS